MGQHKLSRFKDQIELFKGNGDSVREISRKLTEIAGEHVPASTVQHFLKQSNGSGDVQIDPALILARLDELEKKWELDLREHRKWMFSHFKFLAGSITSWAEIIVGILLLHESLIVDYRGFLWGGVFSLGLGMWGVLTPAKWGTAFQWVHEKFVDWRKRR